MNKQLNIFYQLEKELLYKGIKEHQEAINKAFNEPKTFNSSISLKDCFEWLKQGNNIKDYKPILKL